MQWNVFFFIRLSTSFLLLPSHQYRLSLFQFFFRISLCRDKQTEHIYMNVHTCVCIHLCKNVPFFILLWWYYTSMASWWVDCSSHLDFELGCVTHFGQWDVSWQDMRVLKRFCVNGLALLCSTIHHDRNMPWLTIAFNLALEWGTWNRPNQDLKLAAWSRLPSESRQDQQNPISCQIHGHKNESWLLSFGVVC